MGIRPKTGDKVSFNSWLQIDKGEAPPTPWTGVVESVDAPSYRVRRDHDGHLVDLRSGSMRYLDEGKVKR